MIHSEDSRRNIHDRCVGIILSNPEIFPVSRAISDKQLAKCVIDRYIGLASVIDTVSSGVARIWDTVPSTTCESLVKWTIISVLYVYADKYDINEFNQMCQTENLDG